MVAPVRRRGRDLGFKIRWNAKAILSERLDEAAAAQGLEAFQVRMDIVLRTHALRQSAAALGLNGMNDGVIDTAVGGRHAADIAIRRAACLSSRRRQSDDGTDAGLPSGYLRILTQPDVVRPAIAGLDQEVLSVGEFIRRAARIDP